MGHPELFRPLTFTQWETTEGVGFPPTGELAKQRMTVKNAVEFGQLAEKYNTKSFLSERAKFIVEKDVHMEAQDMSPKLATMVFKYLKGDLQTLKDDNKTLYVGRNA